MIPGVDDCIPPVSCDISFSLNDYFVWLHTINRSEFADLQHIDVALSLEHANQGTFWDTRFFG